MRKGIRIGCAVVGAVMLMLIVLLVVAFWLATTSVGPQYDPATSSYTVDDGAGRSHVDHISDQGAASFDGKIADLVNPSLGNARTSGPALARALVQGLTFSEEEFNAKIAQLWAAKPQQGRASIDRIFVVLHAGQPMAYAYTTVLGMHATVASHFTYVLKNNTVTVTLTDPHVGKLPVGVVLPYVLDWSGKRETVASLLALVVPRQVSSIEIRERELHVTLSLLPAHISGGRSLNASRPARPSPSQWRFAGLPRPWSGPSRSSSAARRRKPRRRTGRPRTSAPLAARGRSRAVALSRRSPAAP